jgi:hypothetical protein
MRALLIGLSVFIGAYAIGLIVGRRQLTRWTIRHTDRPVHEQVILRLYLAAAVIGLITAAAGVAISITLAN